MSTPKITIVGDHTVKPVGAPAHEGSLRMSAWDQIFGFYHVRIIHFYNPDSQEWLETLKSSLGRALAHFSPLAGRLRWFNQASQRLEINCNGEGAKLVEAECEGEMSWFRDVRTERLKWLVPAVDYKWPVDEVPLLLVQLTKFRCGGVALGISSSHAVADGQSVGHFLSEWARLARGEPIKEAPSHDRSIFTIRDRPHKGRRLSFSDHIEFESLPLLLGKKDNIEERKKETLKIVLPLTKAQMETLKNIADSAFNDIADRVYHGFSRYEVLASHIWRCASKARGHKYEQPTSLSFSMDVRSRLHTTPITERYFGNTILLMRVRSHVGELLSNPLGFACRKLREAINKVDENYIWSNFDLLEEKEDISFYLNDSRVLNTTDEGNPFHVNPNFRFVNWLRLPIHDMDFGWGNKIDTIPIASDIDGSLHFLPGPKDDGSVAVVLCLQRAHMDNFKKHFYEDVVRPQNFGLNFSRFGISRY